MFSNFLVGQQVKQTSGKNEDSSEETKIASTAAAASKR